MIYLKLTLSAGLLWWILSPLDWHQIFLFAKQMSGPSLLGFCVLIHLSYIIGTLRWYLVLDKKQSFLKLWKITLIGFFFNQSMPSSVGGDVYRVFLIKGDVSSKKAILSVLFDRGFGLLTMGNLAVLVSPYFADLLKTHHLFHFMLLGAGTLLLGLGGSFFILKLSFLLPKKGKVLRQVFQSVPIPSKLITIIAVSFLSNFLFMLAIYTLSSSLSCPLNLFHILFVFPLVIVFSALPISFAGWGLREGALLYFLGLFGVPVAQIMALSLLLGFLQILTSLPGVFLWLANHKKLPQKEDNTRLQNAA